MTDANDDDDSKNRRPDRFATTEWSVVVRTRDPDPAVARQALERLCRDYWYPVYACVRDREPDAHAAQDLTQEFFARFLERHAFERADPARGRLRAFLGVSVRNFLANERAERRASKRGGGVRIVSIDVEAGESRRRAEPSHVDTPEKAYDRRWALHLVERALDALREEYARSGREATFEALKSCVAGGSIEDLREATRSLNLSDAAAKQAAHRLRKRYRELFRREVRRTLADGEDVDDEIRALRSALE